MQQVWPPAASLSLLGEVGSGFVSPARGLVEMHASSSAMGVPLIVQIRRRKRVPLQRFPSNIWRLLLFWGGRGK